MRRCENNGAPRFRMTSSRFPDPTRLSDLPLSGRRLLLRADLNVPLEGGQIADDSRIRAAEAGVRMALEAGASVALASHLGRPKGGATDPAALGLAPVAARLSELLEIPLPLAPDVAGPGSRELAAALRPGEALLLENLRFDPGEARNDPDFARRLASLADEYANDAFGAAHRAHASVDACPKLFARPAAGPLLLREIETLGTLLDDPPRPFVAILGGAKISDKLPALDALLARADRVLVGGAMQYTFFAAQGLPVGNSLLEPEQIPWARQLLASAGDRLELPKDQITATDPGAKDAGELAVGRDAPPPWMGLDIGNATLAAWSEMIKDARTVVWNGPLGLFENPRFARGTIRIAEAVAAAADRGALTVVGGGDSLAAVRAAGVQDRIGHLSTGGGATLAFLAGDRLPGVEALAHA